MPKVTSLILISFSLTLEVILQFLCLDSLTVAFQGAIIKKEINIFGVDVNGDFQFPHEHRYSREIVSLLDKFYETKNRRKFRDCKDITAQHVLWQLIHNSCVGNFGMYIAHPFERVESNKNLRAPNIKITFRKCGK